MTFEELNEVRTLKKQITGEKQKLRALRECAESTTTKYTRETDKHGTSWTSLDISPKGKNPDSKIETLTALIVDTESEINNLQARLVEAVPELTKKIQSEITDKVEQTLLIYRYVACKYFRDIGFLMGYSEQWIYWKHNQILKRFNVD